MLSLNSASTAPSHLVFTDPRLESSSVISALLRLLYDHEIPPLYDSILIQDLVDLADKWEITAVDRLVRKELIASLYHGGHDSPFVLFMIAMKLKDNDLAADVIEARDGYTVLQVLFGPKNKYWAYINIVDLNEREYKDFTKMPPAVAWALQRAAIMWDHDYGMNYNSKEGKCRYRQAIGENFRRIMDLSCASFPSVVYVLAERRRRSRMPSSAWQSWYQAR